MNPIMSTFLARLSGTLLALSVSGACLYTRLTAVIPAGLSEKVLEGFLAGAVIFGGLAAWGVFSLITFQAEFTNDP